MLGSSVSDAWVELFAWAAQRHSLFLPYKVLRSRNLLSSLVLMKRWTVVTWLFNGTVLVTLFHGLTTTNNDTPPSFLSIWMTFCGLVVLQGVEEPRVPTNALWASSEPSPQIGQVLPSPASLSSGKHFSVSLVTCPPSTRCSTHLKMEPTLKVCQEMGWSGESEYMIPAP